MSTVTHVPEDDGVTYHPYVTELAYLRGSRRSASRRPAAATAAAC